MPLKVWQAQPESVSLASGTPYQEMCCCRVLVANEQVYSICPLSVYSVIEGYGSLTKASE